MKIKRKFKVALGLVGIGIMIVSFQNCGSNGGFSTLEMAMQNNPLDNVVNNDFSSVQSQIFAGKCASCHSGANPEGGYDLSSYQGVMAGGRVIPFKSADSLLIQRVLDGTMPVGGSLSKAEIDALVSWVDSGALEKPAVPGQNELPTVNAGADHAVTLPTNSTDLQGSAVDSDGDITQVTWIQISGPTSAKINSPNALFTQVVNLAVGVYEFQLRVTDNDGGVATDNIVVTVNPEPGGSNPSTFSSINANILAPKCVSCHSALTGYKVTSYDEVLKKVTPGNASGSVLYQRVLDGTMPQGGPPLTNAETIAIKYWIEAGAPNN